MRFLERQWRMTAVISKLQTYDINQPTCWKAKLCTLGKERARQQNKHQSQTRKQICFLPLTRSQDGVNCHQKIWDCEALPQGVRKGIIWPKREARELSCFHSCWLLAHVKMNPAQRNKVCWITDALMLKKPSHTVSYSLDHLFHSSHFPRNCRETLTVKPSCSNHYKLFIFYHINSYLPINFSLHNGPSQTNWCDSTVCFWIPSLMNSSWFKTIHHYRNWCIYSKWQK